MRFDAVVVGSGFGGSVCAAKLAERGMRVLILERGPWWGPLQRDRPALDHRDLPRGIIGVRKLLRNLRVSRRGRRFELVLNTDGLLEFHRFDHLNSLTASGVGGGSHIYTAILEEPPPEFFDAFPPEITGRDRMGLMTVHPLGGCSMARSADEGFTDHRGQVFGFPGLFIADGSLYPRSPGIAPSMTIAALAERQASLMA